MTDQTTIQCDCPRCGRVCGFKACYAGRTARCLNCQARFTIPTHSDRPATLQNPEPLRPLPGFYANALNGGLKTLFHRESRVGLFFCAALVIFHFFLGNEDLSFSLPGFRPPFVIGWIVTCVTFGCFAWYSMEVIATARMGAEPLPPVEPGRGFEFIWLVVKSCYLFAVTLIVALLPASFISAWFEYCGMTIGPWYYVLAALCLLLWPINLAIIALEVPLWRIFRYDLLIVAIGKTVVPYGFTVILTLAAFFVLYLGVGHFAGDEITGHAVLGVLGVRLAGAGLFLFAMRIVGVYCLHYADSAPELWVTTPPQPPGGD